MFTLVMYFLGLVVPFVAVAVWSVAMIRTDLAIGLLMIILVIPVFILIIIFYIRIVRRYIHGEPDDSDAPF